ncbi:MULTISPECIES: hypothetical protein [Methylomonas]|uniref:Exonuclease domain-containing protein n=1 Tax=Methylomonas koyamae TaxID=702114 RepID=A0A177NR56_9GAMM|nr:MULTISPECIES: hypothetical protein [Methylomonas]MDT4328380.1 hypothetical protein [Methylomonas sp. MV1]NJA06386.1 hypothetical protein [Methylococcaceae bacterium WWC4]OAI20024.1 hypothetical protein A1355_03515 [Methylomonas koyamae]WGS88321.1 hypothetical protein QC632_11295 [Methylomonas sp. UP202]
MENRRPNVIDFEASGFGVDSYPIEVGVVLADGQKYCALIKPAQSWRFWDGEAERVHGLSRELLLAHGKPIQVVVGELNAFLGNRVVYSDGWVVDKPWLSRLYYDAHAQPSFYLSPLENILKESQMAIWSEIKHEVIETLALQRHRASSDALIVQETFARTREISALPAGSPA